MRVVPAPRLLQGRSEGVQEILEPPANRISAKAKVKRLDRALTVEMAGVTNRLEKVVKVATGISLFIRDQRALPAFQNPLEEGTIPIVPIAIGSGMTATRNHLEKVRILSPNDQKVRLVSPRSLVSEVIPIPIVIGTIGTIPSQDRSENRSQNHSFNPG